VPRHLVFAQIRLGGSLTTDVGMMLLKLERMGAVMQAILLMVVLAYNMPNNEDKTILVDDKKLNTFSSDVADEVYSWIKSESFSTTLLSELNQSMEIEKMKDIAGCTEVSCYAEIAGGFNVPYVLFGTRIGSNVIFSIYKTSGLKKQCEKIIREKLPLDTRSLPQDGADNTKYDKSFVINFNNLLTYMLSNKAKTLRAFGYSSAAFGVISAITTLKYHSNATNEISLANALDISSQTDRIIRSQYIDNAKDNERYAKIWGVLTCLEITTSIMSIIGAHYYEDK